MMRALRVAYLFTVYASLGWVANYAAMLLADEGAGDVRVDTRVDVQVDAEDVDVRVRSSGACGFAMDRQLSVQLADGASLEIDAGAGSLVVEGRESATEITAVGRACASTTELLEELVLSAETFDGEVRLSAHGPDRPRWRDGDARIDLVVIVPVGLTVGIDDSSGGIVVSGTGDLRIADSSGSIAVQGTSGSVRIDDSSGSIEVEGSEGDVEITDGSGGIEIRSVAGSVAVRDGSGGIEIVGVGADVLIEADGSGSIDVHEVVGDFVVDRDGSGGIRYSGIAGRVEVPDRARR